MAEPARRRTWIYVLAMLIVAGGTVGVLWLLGTIRDRQDEARQVVFRLEELDESTVDPAVWGRNFPRQYDTYRRPVDEVRTRHGGNEAFQRLDEFPRWRTIFAGYGFAIDYREERGHAFMLSDQEESERVRQLPQPGACLHCHSSVLPAYRDAGREAGVADTDDFNWPQILKGFEVVCGMPYGEARELVAHPVACIDCHDPQTMQLRVTRPGFLVGLQALARSEDPVPHLPTLEAWRRGRREGDYDPNVLATRQEMRSFVCGQCHVEYYFQGEGKLLVYPWENGLKSEQMLAYYDEHEYRDWVHARSGAPVLKAQHPEFEMWSQGIHARSGVSCADCHMPYERHGAVKVSDHQVKSPLLNVSASCQVCHAGSESDLQAKVETIQDRTRSLMDRAEIAVVALIDALAGSPDAADETALAEARRLHRESQWRLDFVAAENSMGFHASQETARILGEAIDLARQGEIALLRSGAVAAKDDSAGGQARPETPEDSPEQPSDGAGPE